MIPRAKIISEDDDTPPPTNNAVPDFKRDRQERRNAVDLVRLDRLPPHSIEAEQGILGCILIDPVAAMVRCRKELTMGSEVFYDLRHQTVYEVALEMDSEKNHIDLITFSDRLRTKQKLDEVGGIGYLSSLQDATPSAANIGHYLDIAVEKWRLRKFIAGSTEIVTQIYEGAPSSRVSEIADRTFGGVMRSAGNNDSILTLSREVADNVSERMAGGLKGLECGMRSIDSVINGFFADLVFFAARPSMGKTAMLLTIARNIAKAGKRCGIISAESTGKSLVNRMVSAEAYLDLRRASEFEEADIKAVNKAVALVGKLPIQIYHKFGIDINHLCATAIAWHRESPLSALIVDYFQMIEGTKQYRSKEDQYKDCIDKLLHLRSYLGIPVLVASQLNRDAEEKKATLANMSGTGFLEQAGDIVAFIEPEASDKSRTPLPTIKSVARIAKNREGRTGECPLIFRRFCFRFDDEPLGADITNNTTP